MDPKDIKLTDIMHFFNMKPGEFAKEWKELNDAEKDFFRTEVAKEI